MPDSAALKSLNPKHRRFAYEYVVDFHGTKAAIRAGYSKKSARIQASQLLANPNIMAAVQFLAKKVSVGLELTAERTMLEVARLGYSDPRKLFDAKGKLKEPKDWDDNSAAAVAAYDGEAKTFRMWSKTDALHLAARITKIVDSETVPMHLQGNFVVVCPADATPEQWTKLAAAQQKKPVKQLVSVSGSGHLPTHASHGDQD